MKRVMVAIFSLVLTALWFGVPGVTQAAGSATCWADSYELAIGESTTIYCSGYTPKTMIWIYVAEPGGVASVVNLVQSDESGRIAFGWSNGIAKYYSLQLGTFTFVAQELGPAGSIKIFGTVEIRHLGSGDHVAGAHLTTDTPVVERSSGVFGVQGWGFAPGEVVSFWFQVPPFCTSYTSHTLFGRNGDFFVNNAHFSGLSAYRLFDLKADMAGGFSVRDTIGADFCEGTYRLAVRGNTSGLGAYVDFVVTGPSVATNAQLVPSKDRIGAMFETMEFYASGFGAGEVLNCWTTSPDGRALDLGTNSEYAVLPRLDGDGSGSFRFSTGSGWTEGYSNDIVISPGKIAFMSEGALGLWKMTCRGGTSGAIAIAEYEVYGYETAP